MTDAFRAAGLTHLLAVSGQNVAFVLVIAAPAADAGCASAPGWWPRSAVLAGFALVTRAEPSVLRAAAMAAVAARRHGRRAAGVDAAGPGAGRRPAWCWSTRCWPRRSGSGCRWRAPAGIVVGPARLERPRCPGPAGWRRPCR